LRNCQPRDHAITIVLAAWVHGQSHNKQESFRREAPTGPRVATPDDIRVAMANWSEFKHLRKQAVVPLVDDQARRLMHEIVVGFRRH
jgi:hypothetical protein